MEVIHDIVAVKPLDGFRLDVKFDNGEKDVLDFARHLGKPYWKQLNDPAFFRQAFVCYGTIAWPTEIDIGPEDVWEFAERYG